MRVKGTLVRNRLEFLRERFGPEAPPRVLRALNPADQRAIQSLLPASWVPFSLLNSLDAEIVGRYGDGNLEMCRDIGAFAAHRNLASVYRTFLDQAAGDPHRLLEGLAGLHSTSYDWGRVKASRLDKTRGQVEVDYAGGASRTNCLTSVGFYGEALRQLALKNAKVLERSCQAAGGALCLYEMAWDA